MVELESENEKLRLLVDLLRSNSSLTHDDIKILASKNESAKELLNLLKLSKGEYDV